MPFCAAFKSCITSKYFPSQPSAFLFPKSVNLTCISFHKSITSQLQSVEVFWNTVQCHELLKMREDGALLGLSLGMRQPCLCFFWDITLLWYCIELYLCYSYFERLPEDCRLQMDRWNQKRLWARSSSQSLYCVNEAQVWCFSPPDVLSI